MDKDIFTKMAEKWPSALVARTEIKKFTGGLIAPATMKIWIALVKALRPGFCQVRK